jgi:hypothetical protein
MVGIVLGNLENPPAQGTGRGVLLDIPEGH